MVADLTAEVAPEHKAGLAETGAVVRAAVCLIVRQLGHMRAEGILVEERENVLKTNLPRPDFA